jgi:hypothetical protein
MPTPENPQIQALPERFGLSIAGSGGLTLGHAILVLRSQATKGNLLAHELVHVRQYEQAGSISLFLKRYVAELVQFEYANVQQRNTLRPGNKTSRLLCKAEKGQWQSRSDNSVNPAVKLGPIVAIDCSRPVPLDQQ